MEQSNMYKQYLQPMQPMQMETRGAMMQEPVQNYPVRDSRLRQNNENINPYMHDTAYQSQMYDMRRWKKDERRRR